jgi:hypothetical protein
MLRLLLFFSKKRKAVLSLLSFEEMAEKREEVGSVTCSCPDRPMAARLSVKPQQLEV